MSAASDRSRALSAFNGCQNQQLTLLPEERNGFVSLRQSYYVKCPRFPQNTKFVSEGDIRSDESKARAAQGMGCLDCPLAKDEKGVLRRTGLVEVLNPRVAQACGKLFIETHFPQAAFQGYVAVKERLRELTGFEAASQALGKGGLYFLGAEGPHVDAMHQQAGQFTLMSVDAARNQAAHSMPLVIENPRIAEGLAFTKICVSSRAMDYLDASTIRTN